MNTISGNREFLGKLGNMKKEVEWIVYPHKATDGVSDGVLIQSDKRIAAVLLKTKKAMLSDGKGGHPSIQKLSPNLGAVEVDVPEEFLNKIQAIIAKDDGSGMLQLI